MSGANGGKGDRDVAVVGAGIAGLAVALLLHRQGERVTVFERFDAPHPVGSGLLLQPTGQAVMRALGLLETVADLGHRVNRLDGRDRKGRRVLDVSYDALPGDRHGIGVHRHALFDTLYDAVLESGVSIETGWDVMDVEEGRLVRADGRRSARFDAVICAAGAHTPLTEKADVKRLHFNYGALWAALPWEATGGAPDFPHDALAQCYVKAHTMVGVMPCGRPEPDEPETLTFFWSMKPAEHNALVARGLSAWKDDVRTVWPATEGILERIRSFEDLAVARYAHHTLRKPHAERIAFIGDAAHSTSPQLGQGANMALLDAAALAQAFEEEQEVGAAFTRYAALRRWHVRAFQAMSWALTPLYQSDGSTLPWIRDRIMPTLARIPPMPRRLAHVVSGTLLDPLGPLGLKDY